MDEELCEVEMLFTADWIFATEPATTAIIATCVQLFFAWRVRVLTRQWKKISWVLVAMVASTALTSGIAGVLTAWEVVRHPHFAEFQKFHHTVSTWLGATCACDALITIILVVALRRQKTGFQRSDLIVDRIIKLTMQTGLLTMVVAALDLVFYLVSTSGLHLLFSYPLSKLYTNSLMSTLNARKSAFYGSSTASHTNGTDTDGVNTSSGFKNGVSGISRASTHFTLRRDRTSKASDMINFHGHKATRGPEVFVQVEHHALADVETPTETEKQNRHSLYDIESGKGPTVL
ncbi:hypothetical protein CC2G_014104 [Coprinopsis cinerea AmutBmut pab1-1]|nr:hypothetical protein CC2G_014104 [Coprinopsis cinerea AmutBmut pab1-1]